jgi:transposase
MYQLYVGIDIAAASASVAWQGHPAEAAPTLMAIQQKPSDFQRLIQCLRKQAAPSQTLVVMEATSTYWLALAWCLHEAGFVVSVVNPAQPKHFARMQLRRAKTDTLDAQLLLQFAQLTHPEPWTPPPPICEQLQQRLAYRDDLLHIQTQQRNRLHALQHNPHAEASLIQRLQQHLAFLKADIAALSAEVDALLHSQHTWAEATQHLLSIPGIGPISAAWLLVATHCFARCDTPEQAAAFAGLAPHPRDSGSSRRGKRSVGGAGHAPLRRVLYMASAPASRFNPVLKPFYQRLLDKGKPKKVARCAVARKLIHIAWAVVVKHRDFDPDFLLPKAVA